MDGRNRMFALGIVALLAFSGIVFAQSGYPGGMFFFQIPNWWALVVAGLGISVAIISISYMIGEAANLANVKAFAKQEVYELTATIMVIAILIGSLSAYGIFAKNLVGSTLIDSSGGKGTILFGVCKENQKVYTTDSTSGAYRPEAHLFANVDWFLGCLPITSDSLLFAKSMKDKEIDLDSSPYDNMWEQQKEWYGDSHSKGVMLGHMMNIYTGVFALEFMLGPISTFGISTYAPEPILSSISIDVAPTSGLTPVSEALIMLTDMVGMGLVVVMIQKLLLEYIYHNALAVFLPVGIGFRAIPFLRKTGGTIIALSVVLYFIFPISIWINEQIYFNSLFSYDENSGEYVPEMIDWVNYQSLMQICTPAHGETYSEFEQRILQENVKPFYDKTNEMNELIIEDLGGGGIASRLPKSVHKSLFDSFTSDALTIGAYLAHPAQILGPILPTEFLFEAIIDTFTTSMQWFVLNLLFLANTIILCVTFFKDLSLAIGGEPRILGMSRLV